MTSVNRAARTSAKWFARVALWSLVATLIGLGLGPRAGLFRTLVVRSGSMGAAMPAGSLAVVTAQHPGEIEVGQIITYQVPGLDTVVVSHRVIEVDTVAGATTLRTKGDKNERPDPWTAQVTGNTAWRVRAAVPGLGWAVVAFRMPWVRIAASVVAPMLLAVLALHAIWSRPRPRNDPSPQPVTRAPDVDGPEQPAFAAMGPSRAQLEWSRLVQGAGAGPQQHGGPA